MYQLSNYSGKIKNTVTNEVFLKDENEPLYSSYLLWLAQDNPLGIVEFFTEEESDYNRRLIPKNISQRQLRTQLVLSGFDLANVQNAIDGLQDPQKSIAQVAWDYAITFDRESPLLNNLALMLGLTDSDVDQIFINAANL